MEKIKIEGSNEKCVISGENFSYTFVDGHPTVINKNGARQEGLPYPEHKGKKMKSKAKLVHKYWDSALVITKYTYGFEKIEVKYHVLPDGELKQEFIY